MCMFVCVYIIAYLFHSLNNYLLGTYYVPYTVLIAKNTVVNELTQPLQNFVLSYSLSLPSLICKILNKMEGVIGKCVI